jgi:hypothetical protein
MDSAYGYSHQAPPEPLTYRYHDKQTAQLSKENRAVCFLNVQLTWLNGI